MKLTNEEKLRLEESKENARMNFPSLQNFCDRWKLPSIRIQRVLQPICGSGPVCLALIQEMADPEKFDPSIEKFKLFGRGHLVAPSPDAIDQASVALDSQGITSSDELWIDTQSLANRLGVRQGALLLELARRRILMRYSDDDLLAIECRVNSTELTKEISKDDFE